MKHQQWIAHDVEKNQDNQGSNGCRPSALDKTGLAFLALSSLPTGAKGVVDDIEIAWGDKGTSIAYQGKRQDVRKDTQIVQQVIAPARGTHLRRTERGGYEGMGGGERIRYVP